jgi:hypothetical protein
MSLVLGTFAYAEATSLRAWLLFMFTCFVPPLVLLAMWTEGPPQTVAELLHTTEGRR